MSNVIMYTKENCFYCNMAKNLLDKFEVGYEDRNIDSGTWTRAHMLESAPDAKTVPQIFFGEEYVGGFTELQKYLKR